MVISSPAAYAPRIMPEVDGSERTFDEGITGTSTKHREGFKNLQETRWTA